MFTRSLAIAVGLGLSATAAQAGVVNIGCASATCSLADLIGNPGAAIEITGLPTGGEVAFDNFRLISNLQTSNEPGSNPPAPNLQAVQVIGLQQVLGLQPAVGLDILGNGAWASAATDPKEIDTFLTQFSYDVIELGAVPTFAAATLQTNMSGTQNGSHEVTETISRRLTQETLLTLSQVVAGNGPTMFGSLPDVANLTVVTTVTGSGQRPFEGGDTVAVNRIDELFVVPEPGTWLLLLTGVVGLFGTRRRQGRATDKAEGAAC